MNKRINLKAGFIHKKANDNIFTNIGKITGIQHIDSGFRISLDTGKFICVYTNISDEKSQIDKFFTSSTNPNILEKGLGQISGETLVGIDYYVKPIYYSNNICLELEWVINTKNIKGWYDSHVVHYIINKGTSIGAQIGEYVDGKEVFGDYIL